MGEWLARMQKQFPGRPGPLSVVLLLGGPAAERPVSLASGLSVGRALLRLGHHVTFFDPATSARLDAKVELADEDWVTVFGALPTGQLSPNEVDPDQERLWEREVTSALASLGSDSFEVAFSVLHGGPGENGLIAGVLELLGIPVVGSDSMASAVAMDKGHAKDVLDRAGIPIAPDFGWRASESDQGPELTRPDASQVDALGGYPVVVKPFAEGSTFGISIVRSEEDWASAAAAVSPYLHPTRGAMVERFIPGRELTVAVLGGEALPIVEICPESGFYDFERKYTAGTSRYVVPAELPSPLTAQIQGWAVRAYAALGCRDFARVDFRLADDGEIGCLELNTLPGMTSTSLFPMAANAVGIDFQNLLDILCQMAVVRSGEVR